MYILILYYFYIYNLIYMYVDDPGVWNNDNQYFIINFLRYVFWFSTVKPTQKAIKIKTNIIFILTSSIIINILKFLLHSIFSNTNKSKSCYLVIPDNTLNIKRPSRLTSSLYLLWLDRAKLKNRLMPNSSS